MATIISSALTFLDTTDQNQLSAYLTSNFAVVQTCTSDKQVFSPDWSTTPLELQLHAIYDGVDMKAENLDGKIRWYYQKGNEVSRTQIANSSPYSISDYGTKLSVNNNVLSTLKVDSITFICEILLNDVDIATVQMTYTLISDTKAVSFYVGTPGGNMFHNQEGTLEIIAYAHYGVDVIEAGTDAIAGTMNSDKAKFKWEKYIVEKDEYGNIVVKWEEITDTDGLPDQLTIKGDTVLNVATFKCTMTYKGVDYVGVATVQDITDTYISEILTVGGNIFKNGTGGSAAYVMVRINGQDDEVDPIKGTLGVNAPSSYKTGDYWWKIDHTNDRIIQQKYNDSSWVNTTIPQELVYTWTLMDNEGHAKNFHDGSSSKTGKVIYVSCNDIDSTGTVQCVVSKP